MEHVGPTAKMPPILYGRRRWLARSASEPTFPSSPSSWTRSAYKSSTKPNRSSYLSGAGHMGNQTQEKQLPTSPDVPTHPSESPVTPSPGSKALAQDLVNVVSPIENTMHQKPDFSVTKSSLEDSSDAPPPSAIHSPGRSTPVNPILKPKAPASAPDLDMHRRGGFATPMLQARLTPVNRRVPRHLRNAASFPVPIMAVRPDLQKELSASGLASRSSKRSPLGPMDKKLGQRPSKEVKDSIVQLPKKPSENLKASDLPNLPEPVTIVVEPPTEQQVQQTKESNVVEHMEVVENVGAGDAGVPGKESLDEKLDTGEPTLKSVEPTAPEIVIGHKDVPLAPASIPVPDSRSDPKPETSPPVEMPSLLPEKALDEKLDAPAAEDKIKSATPPMPRKRPVLRPLEMSFLNANRAPVAKEAVKSLIEPKPVRPALAPAPDPIPAPPPVIPAEKNETTSTAAEMSELSVSESEIRPEPTTQAPPAPPAPAPPAAAAKADSKPKPKVQRLAPDNIDEIVDTDNEPSWVWDDLLRQIDEEESRYQNDQETLQADMWWTAFKLAWDANMKKGRPARTWWDVEKHWKRVPEPEPEASSSTRTTTRSNHISTGAADGPTLVGGTGMASASRSSRKHEHVVDVRKSTVELDKKGMESLVSDDFSSTDSTPSPEELDSLNNWSNLQDELEKRRMSDVNIRGDIWQLWEEAERRWAEEDKEEEVKSRVAPAGNVPATAAPVSETKFKHDSTSTVQKSHQRDDDRTKLHQRHHRPDGNDANVNSTSTSLRRDPNNRTRRQEDPRQDAPIKPLPNNTNSHHRHPRADADTLPSIERLRKEDAKRRPTVEPRPFVRPINETPMAAAWRSYESRWDALATSTDPITFSTIPWPTLHRPTSPDSISVFSIAVFLLSPEHSSDMPARERVRNAVRRWHTDKFARYATRIVDSERPKIEEGVGVVVRALTQLLEIQRKD